MRRHLSGSIFLLHGGHPADAIQGSADRPADAIQGSADHAILGRLYVLKKQTKSLMKISNGVKSRCYSHFLLIKKPHCPFRNEMDIYYIFTNRAYSATAFISNIITLTDVVLFYTIPLRYNMLIHFERSLSLCFFTLLLLMLLF